MSGSKIAENPLRRCWRKVAEEVAQPCYKTFVERLRVTETPVDSRIIMIETLKALQTGYSRTTRSAACDGVDFSDLARMVTTLNKAISSNSFKSQRHLEGFGDLFYDTLADFVLGPSPAEFHARPELGHDNWIPAIFQLTGEILVLGGFFLPDHSAA